MVERPLVSFIIIAYKQELFIRDAVRSALAQTYEPLEIIVSDDCSPDRTFEIIEEEARTYQGPHRLIVNRNEINKGLAGNLNTAWELSHGEFVVGQGGDDTSSPERTEILVKAWREPTPVDCVFSDFAITDASGRTLTPSRMGPQGPAYSATLAQFITSGHSWVAGCTAAYSADLNRRYGALPSDLVCEDAVLAFRALLGRGIRYVGVPLVQYRRHGANIYNGRELDSGKPSVAEKRRWNLDRVRVAHEWMRCLEASGQTSEACRQAVGAIERQRTYEELTFRSPRWMVPYLALQGFREGLSVRNVAGLLKRHLLRL